MLHTKFVIVLQINICYALSFSGSKIIFVDYQSFWMGPIHFGMVQISWTQPKLFEPEQLVQNHFGLIEGQGIRILVLCKEFGGYNCSVKTWTFSKNIETLKMFLLSQFLLTHAWHMRQNENENDYRGRCRGLTNAILTSISEAPGGG